MYYVQGLSRVDHDYHNITALWMPTGSTITLLTLLMQLMDHKDTIIIHITSKFKLLSTLLLTSFSLALEYVFFLPIFFTHELLI